jgi:hypothetical protein
LYWTLSPAVAYRGAAVVMLVALVLAQRLPRGSREAVKRE